MIVRVLTSVAFVLIVNGCGGQQPAKTAQIEAEAPVFEMVSIPSMITNPDERAVYLVKHYWDKFNFTDTTLIRFPEVTEQGLSNYLDMMKYVSPESAASSIKEMMHKAEADSSMFAHISSLYEKYLYDPNSPMRNESLYISVLQATLEAQVLDEVQKIRPAHLLELALKNREGEPATDFTYTLANGQKGTLYGVKANYLLLFFNNPDCSACKEITHELSTSAIVNERIDRKELKILAVYTDEDLAAWKNHLSSMPVHWINSYDESIGLKNDEVYDLKAIPALYLLDKDKKVLLKDVTFDQIEAYFQKQTK